MKVSVIRPPAYSKGLMGAQLVPVLGIVYIGAALREAGHEVDVIDMCAEDIDHIERLSGGFVQYGMPPEALDRRLRWRDAIIFSCMFSQDWPFHRSLIQAVKMLSADSWMIAGGEHVSALPEYCLRDCPELDVCVVGEGEDTIVELLKEGKKQRALNRVQGVVIRNDAGTQDSGTGETPFVRTPRRQRIRDIDALPLPAWDLIPVENYLSRGLNYHIRRGRTLPMLATRGCPYRCTFCSNLTMWGVPWIPRSPVKVADEMELYAQRYHVDNFVFSDLTVVINKQHITDLCREIIKRNLGVTWQLPTLRTEAVDRDVLKLLYEAGCRELDFAIESGSRQVLDSVSKKNDPRQIFGLIEDALDAGMNLSTNIVIGLPSERWRDFGKTYALLMRLAVRGLHEVNVFPFVPYPGSALFEEMRGRGKVQLNDEYFLSLFGYADLSQPLSWSDHFGPRTLSFLRFVLLSHFYALMLLTHPKRLWKMIANIFTGQSSTKLEGVLKRVIKNLRASWGWHHGKA